MVAKSYEHLNQIGEPFSENGKFYVYVEHKPGQKKKVRFYSEKEYNKLYPKTKEFFVIDDRRAILGFEDNFVYLVYSEDEEVLRSSNARYCRWWGWYVPSNENVDKELTIVEKLNWEEAKERIDKV